MKSGFVLLSRDADLIGLALQIAAAVNVELRLLDEYPVITGAEYLVADPKALIDQPNLKPDLLISQELSDSLWRFAANYSPAQLVQLPEATSWFQSWLTNQQVLKAPVLMTGSPSRRRQKSHFSPIQSGFEPRRLLAGKEALLTCATLAVVRGV
ncbi:MAG: hypothetical protein ACO3CN_06630 [Candidatus Nanopelagicales bacterium]